MIKVLRRKFIFTAMLAVLILLIVMFGVLNVMNYFSMNRYSDIVLENLVNVYNMNPVIADDLDNPENTLETPEEPVEMPGESGSGESGDDGGSEPAEEPDSIEDVTPLVVHFGFIEPEVNINDILRAAYYTVSVDQEGNIGYTDISRIADVTEVQAQYYAADLFKSGRQSGWYEHSKFLRAVDKNGDYVYIFLDRQPELINLRKLLLMSLAIMIVCAGIFLLLITLVSGKMLRPIVDNMEQQKSFITNAGHEIKTPLAIIQANTEAMELFSGENKWTSNIKEQIRRLSVLMNNMLTLAKAQEGVSNLPKAEIDLTLLIRDFLKMFHEPAARKNVTIAEELESDLIIRGNKVQAGQAISIVIDNAVKYCAPDSTINIRLSSKDRNTNAVLEIANLCEKLPDCDPERLFERFYRPDISRYSDVGGNGIGLSAARAIAESMGGGISCRYEEGNRIVFSLVFKK